MKMSKIITIVIVFLALIAFAQALTNVLNIPDPWHLETEVLFGNQDLKTTIDQNVLAKEHKGTCHRASVSENNKAIQGYDQFRSVIGCSRVKP